MEAVVVFSGFGCAPSGWRAGFTPGAEPGFIDRVREMVSPRAHVLYHDTRLYNFMHYGWPPPLDNLPARLSDIDTPATAPDPAQRDAVSPDVVFEPRELLLETHCRRMERRVLSGNYRRVTIIGHSIGALFALRLAAMLPAHLVRVTLCIDAAVPCRALNWDTVPLAPQITRGDLRYLQARVQSGDLVAVTRLAVLALRVLIQQGRPEHAHGVVLYATNQDPSDAPTRRLAQKYWVDELRRSGTDVSELHAVGCSHFMHDHAEGRELILERLDALLKLSAQ